MAVFGAVSAGRQTIVALGILAVLSLGVYANTLDNDFVLDDTAYVRDNYILRDLSNIPRFFNVPPDGVVEDLSPGLLRGRNIRWLTFALDYRLGGGSPFVFHATNILWHTIAGIALFFLLRGWLGSVLHAFAGAAIFLVHPIQTNAVAYIFGRKDLLAAAFVLLTFLAVRTYRESTKARYLGAAGAYFFIAFFSKEVAAVFPLLLLWADLCLRSEAGWFKTLTMNCRRYLREYLLFFVLAGIFAWRQFGPRLAAQFTETASNAAALSSLATAGGDGANLSFANVILFYFWKIVYPLDLLADYRGVFRFSLYPEEWGWFISPAFVAALLFLLLWLRRRWPEGALGIGWIVIALLPVSHIVDFHFPVAEHYIYLPFAGIAMFLSSLLQKSQRFVGMRWMAATTVLLLLLFAGATVRRNMDWQDMKTLTRDILEKAPGHVRARSTLVHLYMADGDYDRAMSQARRVLQIAPGSAVNHFNLAILYEKTGDVELAVAHYRQAISRQRTMWDAYLNLADLLLQHGREREGLEVVERLTKLYGYHPLVYYVLGNHEARKGSWAQALPLYRRSIDLDPQGAPGYLGIAGSLWTLGDRQQAEIYLRKALALGLDPGWAKGHEPWTTFLGRPEVRHFLGTIKKKEKKTDEH